MHLNLKIKKNKQVFLILYIEISVLIWHNPRLFLTDDFAISSYFGIKNTCTFSPMFLIFRVFIQIVY